MLEARVVLGGQGRDGLGEPVARLMDDHRGHDRRRMIEGTVEGTVKVLVGGPFRGIVRGPIWGIVKDWVRHAPARLVAALTGTRA